MILPIETAKCIEKIRENQNYDFEKFTSKHCIKLPNSGTLEASLGMLLQSPPQEIGSGSFSKIYHLKALDLPGNLKRSKILTLQNAQKIQDFNSRLENKKLKIPSVVLKKLTSEANHDLFQFLQEIEINQCLSGYRKHYLNYYGCVYNDDEKENIGMLIEFVNYNWTQEMVRRFQDFLIVKYFSILILLNASSS